MKSIAVVLCNKRDEHMLPVFIDCWEDRSDIELVVASDWQSPIEKSYGIRSHRLDWSRKGPLAPGVAYSLLDIAFLHSADRIIKLDVDVVHLDTSWIQGEDDMLGFEHVKDPRCVLGAGYAVSVAALREVFHKGHLTNGRAEDRGMSRGMRAGGKEINILPRKNGICGAGKNYLERIERYRKYKMIHCGQFGKTEEGRRKAKDAMVAFINEFKVTA